MTTSKRPENPTRDENRSVDDDEAARRHARYLEARARKDEEQVRKEKAQQDRLTEALRLNLRRRKSQARGRRDEAREGEARGGNADGLPDDGSSSDQSS